MITIGASSSWPYLQLAVIATAGAIVCALCGRWWRSDFYLWLATAAVAAIICAAV
jgi:hypothetical protein